MIKTLLISLLYSTTLAEEQKEEPVEPENSNVITLTT